MRGLSPDFMSALQIGILRGLRERVIADKDLDLQIREGYLNIYYKGSSLLRLIELASSRYRVDIHAKFLGDLELPDIGDQATAQRFLDAIPRLFQEAEASLASLDFAEQIRIFHTGFALWQRNLRPPAKSTLGEPGEGAVEEL